MPRPSTMTAKNASAGKRANKGKSTKNSLFAWFEKRKETREEAKAEAAREITEKKAKNEEKISFKLKSINFVDSILPAEVLQAKRYEEQPCGDIQFQILGAISRIENNTQDYTGLDIRRIDSGIYQISFLAKQAIDGGHVNAARAACHALSVTIGEIRDKIPSVPAPLQKEFIESSEKYIDIWIDYITNCTVLDGLENNAKVREEAISKTQQEIDHEMDLMAERLINDEEYKKKYERIQNETYAIHGSTWDDDMKQLYNQLLTIRIKKSSLNFEILCHNGDLEKVVTYRRILDGFRTKLRTIPQPEDPNLMNKFNELINETVKEAAQQDQQFDEFFQELDRIDAMINQLANSAGNLRAREEAGKQINEVVQRAQKKLMEESGIKETQEGGFKIRLYTKAQLEQMKRAQEEQQAQQEMQAQQEQQVQQETQVNKNRVRNAN